jgi:hypothetical protein
MGSGSRLRGWPRNPYFSGAFMLDTPQNRRYIRDTLRQAVSFACSARPTGQLSENIQVF